MEEILASIRRIIADDSPEAKAAAQQQPAPQPAPVVGQVPPPPPPMPPKQQSMSQQDIDAMLADQASDDVLDLTDPVPPPQPQPPAGFRQVPANDVMFREEEEDLPPLNYPAAAPEPQNPPEVLLSPETNAAVTSAFGSLATTILSENSRTLEDLVREMLRPMLKAWLDDNLPGLVERMVRAEIERVSRGRS